MKRLFYVTFLLGLFCTQAKASHLMGGELRYESDGSNYYIYLTLYRDCSGIALPTAAVVNISSANASYGVSHTLQKVSETDVTPPCAGYANQCTNPNATLPGFRVGLYKGVVTLPSAAADWVFSYNAGARTSMTNINGGNLYLEAKLNNMNGYNSNPYTPAQPPMIINLSANTAPLYTLDPDGDSVVFTRIAPMVAANTSASYATGFSPTSPFGSGGTYTLSGNGKDESVTLDAVLLGKHALAYRVDEYRNGVRIGSYIRDFAVMALSGGSSYSYPTLRSGAKIEVFTCPGSADTANFSFYDPVSTDSVFITIDTPALAGWNFNGFVQNASPFASGRVAWTAPANLNPLTTPFFFITLNVYDDACPRAATKYPILVKTRACSADSVWPGDANNDNVVNLLDPLAIAVTYGNTGPARPNASNSWTPQYAADWAANIPSTATNQKYTDCDGNGTIGLSDLVPVASNWALTHPKGGTHNKTTGVPDLYFDVNGLQFVAGQTVSVPIMLGSNAQPMDDLYGLASRIAITIDGALPTSQATVTTATSWVGTAANTLTFNKDIDKGTIDWAYARIDHQSTGSQYGQIATLTFTVPANAKYGDVILLQFMSPTLIDKDGKTINDYNANDATAAVGIVQSVAGVNGAIGNITIVPNPSGNNAMLQVSLNKTQQLNVTVTDITGKQVWSGVQQMDKGNGIIALPATNMASGVYMVMVTDADGNATTLKWIKQ